MKWWRRKSKVLQKVTILWFLQAPWALQAVTRRRLDYSVLRGFHSDPSSPAGFHTSSPTSSPLCEYELSTASCTVSTYRKTHSVRKNHWICHIIVSATTVIKEHKRVCERNPLYAGVKQMNSNSIFVIQTLKCEPTVCYRCKLYHFKELSLFLYSGESFFVACYWVTVTPATYFLSLFTFSKMPNLILSRSLNLDSKSVTLSCHCKWE